MKNKNIRAKLKQQNFNFNSNNLNNSIEKEKIDNNKSSEVEISFNITPEEDELKRSINSSNKKTNIPPNITSPPGKVCNYSANTNLDISELEKANIENQKQVESLLEKTKSFLEKKDSTSTNKPNTSNLEDNGIFVKIPSNSLKPNRINNHASEKPSINTSAINDKHKSSKSIEDYSALENCYNVEESPYDMTGIKKIGMINEKLLSKENLPSNNGSLINNSSSCININSINQRLLEKIKIIKNLEKELKEKNNTIQKLNSKLDKQKEEIIKLNEKLNTEKQAPFIRNENIELQKKLKNKEQELLEKNRIFEEVVGEYKSRLEKVMLTNNSSLEKIKEIENVNKSLVQTNQTLENNFKTFKLTLDKEVRDRKNLEDKINHLNSNVKSLLKLIANYKNNLTNLNENNKNVFEKINRFFIPEKNEYPTDNKNYLLESNLTNSINYYQDEDYMIK